MSKLLTISGSCRMEHLLTEHIIVGRSGRSLVFHSSTGNLPPPNLNPIENVWFLLKDRLNKRYLLPQGLEGIGEAIKEEWNGISEVHLLTFVDSILERIEAVIAASGGHTCW